MDVMRYGPETLETGSSASETKVRLGESNGQMPSTRWDSRKKLSILCILCIPALVQPSSATAVSTSWRRGSIYSGLERRRYNTSVDVCVYSQLVVYEEIGVAYKRSSLNSYKVDCEQSPCKAFKGPFHSLGFTHQPHEHVILYLRITITVTLSKLDRRTGLSSQSSPNSLILAKRSSTIGLMNSISCRICDGRLDSTRATILTPAQ